MFADCIVFFMIQYDKMLLLYGAIVVHGAMQSFILQMVSCDSSITVFRYQHEEIYRQNISSLDITDGTKHRDNTH